MGTIRGLINRVKRMDLNAITAAAFEECRPALEQASRDQLERGLNRFEEVLSPAYRSSAYARLKESMNPLPGLGVPDLKLTGAFHRGIYAEIKGDRIVWGSKDAKSEKLQQKYDGIFGLNRTSRAEFIRQHLRPAIHRKIEAATGLRFSK